MNFSCYTHTLTVSHFSKFVHLQTCVLSPLTRYSYVHHHRFTTFFIHNNFSYIDFVIDKAFAYGLVLSS